MEYLDRELPDLPALTPIRPLEIRKNRRIPSSESINHADAEVQSNSAFDALARGQAPYPRRTSSLANQSEILATRRRSGAIISSRSAQRRDTHHHHRTLSQISNTLETESIHTSPGGQQAATNMIPANLVSSSTGGNTNSADVISSSSLDIIGDFVPLEPAQDNSRDRSQSPPRFKYNPDSRLYRYFSEMKIEKNPYEFEPETPESSEPSLIDDNSPPPQKLAERDQLPLSSTINAMGSQKKSLGAFEDNDIFTGHARSKSVHRLKISESSPAVSTVNQLQLSGSSAASFDGSYVVSSTTHSPSMENCLFMSPTTRLDNLPEKPEPSPNSGNGLEGYATSPAGGSLDVFPNRNNLQRRKSTMKKMFGERGFLGRTTDPDELPDSKYKTGKPSMVTAIQNKLKELTDIVDLSPIKRSFVAASSGDLQGSSAFPISLNPYEQGTYSMKLEVLICGVANEFIMSQLQAGRISMESVKKLKDSWSSKGRAPVLEFQYDQITQRNFIKEHKAAFHFHGENAASDKVGEILMLWKYKAREMATRTFCNTDSTIREQILGMRELLPLLGASDLKVTYLYELLRDLMEEVRSHKEGTPTRAANATRG